MSTLRHGRCGAPDGPLGTELTSVFVLRASTVGVQRTPLASMVSVDGAGSSATGGEAEVPHSQLRRIGALRVEPPLRLNAQSDPKIQPLRLRKIHSNRSKRLIELFQTIGVDFPQSQRLNFGVALSVQNEVAALRAVHQYQETECAFAGSTRAQPEKHHPGPRANTTRCAGIPGSDGGADRSRPERRPVNHSPFTTVPVDLYSISLSNRRPPAVGARR